MKKSILLLSGGLDSLVLLASEIHNGNKPLSCLAFDYGQRHQRELQAAAWIANHYDVPCVFATLPAHLFGESALTSSAIPVPEAHYDDQAQRVTIVPNRNMVFLALAGSLAVKLGAEKVLFAAHRGDSIVYPDCRPQFVYELSDAMDSACKVKVVAPFLQMDKKAIVQLGRKLRAPMHMAWSCYKGGEEPCGECGACRERLIAEVQP